MLKCKDYEVKATTDYWSLDHEDCRCSICCYCGMEMPESEEEPEPSTYFCEKCQQIVIGLHEEDL
jgi:hypothetical protein